MVKIESVTAEIFLTWTNVAKTNAVPGESSSLSAHNPDGEIKINMEHSRSKSVILVTANNKRLESVIIPGSDEMSESKDKDIIL